MKISGKSLPPRAALLLSCDFVVLVIIVPMLFMVPLLTSSPERFDGNLFRSMLRLVVVGLVCQMIFYYHELYNLQVIRQGRQILVRVLRAFGTLFLLYSVVAIATPSPVPVLLWTLAFAVLVAPVTMLSRRLALPRAREQVLLVGTGDEVAEVQDLIRSSPEWNMEVACIAQPSSFASTVRAAGASQFNRVIVTRAEAQSTENLAHLLELKMNGMAIEDAQSFFERATGRVRLDQLKPAETIFTDGFTNHSSKRMLKRALDIVLVLPLFVTVAPLMAVVSVLIWLQGDGPVLFRQQRAGLFGRPFCILKFRTMAPIADDAQTGWAGDETHRITPLGRYLRKYRIDELPQLLNILKGEMSLIGPRPEQPHLCAILEEYIPFYRHRHSVKPGLTGWAQVRYHYGSSIEESRRKAEYDLFYVKHLSFWLDCAIVLETVKVVLVGRGAL